ncbi:modulator of macroautophagy TMEM150B [Osmerus mordax]|uniref:modulator of macroautophagy TMEM150B n=1 Tax=Osmerus mordax TaxID=8014 RepID=UPI0035102102
MWLWALLPVGLAVFGTVGIWLVFGMAVSNGTVNVTVEFPYISTCGSFSPQSCIFSQVCNTCAVLALWVVVIRFQQIRDYGDDSKVNLASIILGFISSIGISIIGNFQQSVLLGPHLLGACLAFFVGLVYFWLQAWLTYRAAPSPERCWVGLIRTVCCSSCTLLVILMAVFHNTGNRTGGAICEWALVMIFFVQFGLFGAEFRHIDYHKLTVQRKG